MVWRTGRKRVEQIKQVVGGRMLQRRRPAVAVPEEGDGRAGGLGAGEVRGTGTAHGQAVPGTERRAEELGPGEAQVVPGEGEGPVLPEAAADELRANVQEDAGVRSADREPHRPDERVLGPLQHRRQERRPESGFRGQVRERHQTVEI